MDDVAEVRVIDGAAYVSVAGFMAHMHHAAESVEGFCPDTDRTRAVVATLRQTGETLAAMRARHE